MIVDLLQFALIGALIGYTVAFSQFVRKALGIRADWKRRFDKMKEILGL